MLLVTGCAVRSASYRGKQEASNLITSISCSCVLGSISLSNPNLEFSSQRDELFKAAGMLAGVHTLLEKGDVEDRHAAMGCLVALAASEKHFMDVVTYRVGTAVEDQQIQERVQPCNIWRGVSTG